jgi:hypothetical protein
MRTLKTLAALGALLLVASSASATLTFTVHAQNPLDDDATQGFQLDVTLSAGQTLDLYGFNWTFTSGTPVGGPPDIACANVNQSQCSYGPASGAGGPAGAMAGIGGNANGTNWIWDTAAASLPGGTTHTNTALFTLSGLTNGTIISLGAIEAFDSNNQTITDVAVNPYTVTVVPEPTAVALLGLGLAGLALAGRRKA